ncbi:MAG: hypothetical protein CME84_13980 [Henriciella sp.]|nr:hypothetical protein [Henriciella sp.]
MSSYGPWSVKGSDERAREAARAAAREEGLTIGEYINRMLKMETGSVGDPVSGGAMAARDDETPRYARSGGGGEGGDGEYPGTAAAIHDLLRRLEAMEARSAVALSGIDRSIHDLTERLNDAHRKTDGLSTSYEGVIDDIRTTHDALKSKLDTLEGSGGGRRDVKALKSLEQALGKLASHVYEETSRQKDGTAAVRKRVETGLEDLGARLTGVEGRIDKTLDDAADRLARKVEQAELRTEGATKHLSGRFSDLETRVAERLARVDDMAKRVDQVEALQARLDRAETTTNQALDKVDQTFAALSSRVSDLAEKALPDTATMLREQFESRFRGLSAELRSSIETTRKELAQEIEQAAGKSARHEQVDAVRNAVRDLSDAVERRDSNTQASLGTLRQDMDSAGKSSRAALDELSRRVETNWTASQAALDTLRQRFDSKDGVSAKTLDELRARMDERHDKADSELKSLRDKVENVAADAISPATVDTIQKAVGAIRQRLATSEKTSTETLQKLSERITQMSGLLENQEESPQLEAVRAEMKRLADHFETRIDESEKRSAGAIEQVGEQVSSVAQRLQARQDRSFRELEETLETERKVQHKRLSDALNGVSDRIEEMQERSSTSISPVQKAIASLASRLEALESDDEEPHSRRADAGSTGTEDNAYDDFLTEEAPQPARQRETRRGKPAAAFEAGLPFLDELDEDPPVHAGSAYEYEADLPEEEEIADPFADFSDFDERDTKPEEDVFEETRPRADNSWGLSEAEAKEAAPRKREQPAGKEDYLSRARLAALEASEAPPQKAQKKGKARPAKASAKPRKSSRLPLLAAASVIAIAAAAGAVIFLRGMQEEGPQRDVQTRDTLSMAAAGTDASAEAGETAVDTAPEPDDASRAESVNSVQAPGDDSDLEQDLFAEEEPASESGEGEVSLAGVSDPSVADAGVTGEASTSEPAEQPAPEQALAALSPIPEAQSVESAAIAGDPVAQYLVGQERLDAGDYTSGPSMIRRAAEQGQPAAQYRLAKLHESGLGVPRDLQMAREWTERAANGGNVKAMHDLAVYYAEGEGGPQSYAGAAEWFRKAADYGLTDSQYNLAVLYEAGLGISEDASQALYWYAVAAQQGDSGAPAKVEELSGVVGPQEAATVRARAEGWSAARPDRAANGIFPRQSWQGEASTEQIASVQKTLTALGHEPGPADGLMGAATVAAIRNYQRENGLEESGNVTPQLIESLNARIRAAKS